MYLYSRGPTHSTHSLRLLSVILCILHAVLRGRDPSAVAVLMEDSAAVAGVFVAATALGITHLTGNTMYDAIGSISIGGK